MKLVCQLVCTQMLALIIVVLLLPAATAWQSVNATSLSHEWANVVSAAPTYLGKANIRLPHSRRRTPSDDGTPSHPLHVADPHTDAEDAARSFDGIPLHPGRRTAGPRRGEADDDQAIDDFIWRHRHLSLDESTALAVKLARRAAQVRTDIRISGGMLGESATLTTDGAGDRPADDADDVELAALLRRQASSARGQAGGNTVVVACVNAALVDFALNWHCHLKRIGLTGMLVMAWDDRAHALLQRRGVPVFRDRSGDHHRGGDAPFSSSSSSTSSSSSSPNNASSTSTDTQRKPLSSSGVGASTDAMRTEQVHGTASFVSLVRRKTLSILRVLQHGYSVLYSDVDIALLRNPLPLLTPNLDLEFASDWRIDARPDPGRQYLCTGFFFVRHHARTIRAMRRMLEYQQHPANSMRDDQIAANAVFPLADVGGSGMHGKLCCL